MRSHRQQVLHWSGQVLAAGLLAVVWPLVATAQDGLGHGSATQDTVHRASSVHLEILLARRQLLVFDGADTVYRARIATPSGKVFSHAGTTWRFVLPRGERRVTGKREKPVWVPPDWHYAEVARAEGLRVAAFPATGVRLANGSRLSIRDSVIGLTPPGDTTFLALPTEEHVIFDGIIYIPPMATYNRRIEGMLGAYALDLGGGYMIHGTKDLSSIGRAVTHGCIRLGDRDLAWVYDRVPVGTTVRIR